MEFSSRGFQRSPQPAATGGAHTPQSPERRPAHKKAIHKIKESKSLAILWVVFFASVAALIIAVIISLSARQNEAGAINKDGYQAVFLENGQAYFGKIKKINASTVDLQDIYYLYNGSADGQNTGQNLSLVKLGTELHCPEDRMLINRDQVSFWENINADGKVVKAIEAWKKDNPNGQKCSDASQQTQQQNTSPQQTSTENNPQDSTDTPTNERGTETETNSNGTNTETNGDL